MANMIDIQKQLTKTANSHISNESIKDNDSKPQQKGREGKIHISAWLDPDFKRSLRLVQAQTGEDIQTIIARALNDLYKAHNVPVIEYSK